MDNVDLSLFLRWLSLFLILYFNSGKTIQLGKDLIYKIAPFGASIVMVSFSLLFAVLAVAAFVLDYFQRGNEIIHAFAIYWLFLILSFFALPFAVFFYQDYKMAQNYG